MEKEDFLTYFEGKKRTFGKIVSFLMFLVKRIKENLFKIIFTWDFEAQLKKIETTIAKLLMAWFRKSDKTIQWLYMNVF